MARAGSTLLTVANPTYCTPIDMRGNGRPVGGAGCDIGAIQRNPVDALAPVVAITSPNPNQIFSGTPINIIGFANDNVGVTSVRVAIYRNVAGGQYWNGAAWQAANTTAAAHPRVSRRHDHRMVLHVQRTPRRSVRRSGTRLRRSKQLCSRGLSKLLDQ